MTPRPADPSIAMGNGNPASEHGKATALVLQDLIADISTRLALHSHDSLDDDIQHIQQSVCEKLDLDRSTLWQTTGDFTDMALTHFWQREACAPLRRNFTSRSNLPWADDRIRRGLPFHFSSLDDLPPEAHQDVRTLRDHGTRSNVTFPLMSAGKAFGAIAFATTSREKQWTPEEIRNLQLVSQILSLVIGRMRAEHRVDQLHEEITIYANAALLGELAAAIAHEINQPLTTILSNAQAGRRFLNHPSPTCREPDEIRPILDDIIRDTKRAGDVVRNLRAMLAGNPSSRDSLCLGQLADEVRRFVEPDLKAKGIMFDIVCAQGLPKVRVARVEFQQLLINLLENAAHAMSGTAPAKRRVELTVEHANGCVRIRIRDHGCGIPPEHLDRIFEPFHTTRSKGLGMGLAICRRIVESHQGHISAENHEDGGAILQISLPADPQFPPPDRTKVR